MAASNSQISQLLDNEYQAGFVTDIDTDSVPPGLSEEVIRLISAKKQEPQFLLDWRLKTYRHWQSMQLPKWSSVHYPPIDYNAISYYSSPKSGKDAPASLEDADPKLLETYAELGISLEVQEQLADLPWMKKPKLSMLVPVLLARRSS